jgi:transcriptional regulator with XRE-family HTH domain
MARKQDQRSARSLDKRIAARIRARRLECGITQPALAQTIGVTFQQIQKYENAKNRVAASRLYDIALALDAPIESFFA